MTHDSAPACAAAYDQWAATYDSIDNPLIAQASTVLASHVATWAGARVLELGCGTGRNARACLAAGARSYVGVDASPGMTLTKFRDWAPTEDALARSAKLARYREQSVVLEVIAARVAGY